MRMLTFAIHSETAHRSPSPLPTQSLSSVIVQVPCMNAGYMLRALFAQLLPTSIEALAFMSHLRHSAPMCCFVLQHGHTTCWMLRLFFCKTTQILNFQACLNKTCSILPARTPAWAGSIMRPHPPVSQHSHNPINQRMLLNWPDQHIHCKPGSCKLIWLYGDRSSDGPLFSWP